MRIQSQKPEFTPVEVTFTFHTQDELDFVGGLFNNLEIEHLANSLGVSMDTLLSLDDTSPAWEVLEAAGANLGSVVASSVAAGLRALKKYL